LTTARTRNTTANRFGALVDVAVAVDVAVDVAVGVAADVEREIPFASSSLRTVWFLWVL
jgi:hypothetical protein